MRCQHRHARRADLGHVGPDQLEHQVEVVDHQIEDHRHVGPAGLERRQPLRLEESRLLEIAGRRPHRSVEPLDVPDLQRGPVLLRRAHQALRARERVGEGLLDQGW